MGNNSINLMDSKGFDTLLDKAFLELDFNATNNSALLTGLTNDVLISDRYAYPKTNSLLKKIISKNIPKLFLISIAICTISYISYVFFNSQKTESVNSPISPIKEENDKTNIAVKDSVRKKGEIIPITKSKSLSNKKTENPTKTIPVDTITEPIKVSKEIPATEIKTATVEPITSLNMSFPTATLINQYDANGKKDGKWKLYYDQYWIVVKDTSKAAYYWYTYYDHGMRIYTEADWGCKTCKFQDSLFSEQKEKIKLLDGKYTWYNKKGNLFSEHYFKNGDPIWWKQYHSNGKLYLFFDYTKKCEGEPYSWWLYQYDKEGVLKAEMPTSKGCGGMWSGVR